MLQAVYLDSPILQGSTGASIARRPLISGHGVQVLGPKRGPGACRRLPIFSRITSTKRYQSLACSDSAALTYNRVKNLVRLHAFYPRVIATPQICAIASELIKGTQVTNRHFILQLQATNK